MASIGITGNLQLLGGAVKMFKRVKDRSPLLVAIKIELLSVSRRAFATEGVSLDGQKWHSLNNFTMGRRPRSRQKTNSNSEQRPHKILQNKGLLRKGVIGEINESASTVTIGTAKNLNSQHPEVHQFGTNIKVTPKMRFWLGYRGLWLKGSTFHIIEPRRPFIGLEKGTLKKIEKMSKEYYTNPNYNPAGNK